MLARRFGLVLIPIVDDNWSAPRRTAFWQSMIHLLERPHSTLTLLQINLKAGADSLSRHTPYKQPLFLRQTLCLERGLQSLHGPVKTSHGLGGTEWDSDARETYWEIWRKGWAGGAGSSLSKARLARAFCCSASRVTVPCGKAGGRPLARRNEGHTVSLG